MNIAVFGATGRTGRHIVDQALEDGHTLTVLARYPNRLHREHDRLHVVDGHVQEREKVLQTIAGQDAVLSTIGQVRERPSVAHLLTVSATNITEAMSAHNVERLVFLMGTGVSDPNDQRSLGTRLFMPLIRRIAGHTLRDAEDASEIIRESDLDWTIVRVAHLGDDPPSGNLSVGFHEPTLTPVSRKDVARFMLRQLDDDQYRQQAPVISN